MVIDPNGDLGLSDPESVFEMAPMGMGIAQVGMYHAIDALRAGRLQVLLPTCHVSGDRQMVLQYPHREHLAPPSSSPGRVSATATPSIQPTVPGATG